MLRIATKATGYLVGGASGVGLGAAVYRYEGVRQRESQLPTEPLVVFGKSSSSTPSSSDEEERQEQYLSKPDDDDNNNNNKRVLVIGGGVVGVTAAYKLAKKGHAVTVLEPRPQPGEECSSCAAGGMQRSNPVVDRDSWMAVLKCLLSPYTMTKWIFQEGGKTKNDNIDNNKEDNFKFFHISWADTLTDPFFFRWLVTFTKTSLFPDEHQQDKQKEMLNFTKYAVEDMVDMMEQRTPEYRRDNMARQSGYNKNGSLNVFYDPVIVDENDRKNHNNNDKKGSASRAAVPKKELIHTKKTFEPSQQVVGTVQVLALEPSLQWQERQPTSAKYEAEARSASSHHFTKELANCCVKDPNLNVVFLYETAVQAMTVQEAAAAGKGKPRISKLRTNRGVIDIPDDVLIVVAAGSWTPHIMALLDLYAPVYPLKGYAMSVSANDALRQTVSSSLSSHQKLKWQDLPSRIVSDKYMYTARLGDEIRITSIGEFSGWSTIPTPQVDKEFRQEAIRQFPQLRHLIQQAHTRCGHRPFVSDGILLLGAVDTHENLYVSVGPGSNGWKLAMGSGEIIERLVAGQTAGQIQEELGFDVNVLSPAGRVLKAPLFAKLCRARWNV